MPLQCLEKQARLSKAEIQKTADKDSLLYDCYTIRKIALHIIRENIPNTMTRRYDPIDDSDGAISVVRPLSVCFWIGTIDGIMQLCCFPVALQRGHADNGSTSSMGTPISVP